MINYAHRVDQSNMHLKTHFHHFIQDCCREPTELRRMFKKRKTEFWYCFMTIR